MSPKKDKSKKRKNKSQNVSGESINKKRVTTPQSSQIGINTIRTPGNLKQSDARIMDGNINSPHNLQNHGLTFVQHSTPTQVPLPVMHNMHNISNMPMTPMGNQQLYSEQLHLSPVRAQPPVGNPDLMAKMDSLTLKLDGIFEKLGKLDIIEKRLQVVEESVRSSKEDIKQMNNKIYGVEEGLTFINEKFEDNKKELIELKESVKQIDKLTQSLNIEEQGMREKLKTITSELCDLKERNLDLQSRSMRDNLVFTGIQESPEENIEDVLLNFLKQEMEIELETCKFHRIHRIGRAIPGRPRPIVAKFVLYKEKEMVRKSAIKLKNKPYGINEQYPKEINERRKDLYPHYKRAKQQNMKAVMVGDRLYINNRLFDPSQQHQPMTTGSSPGRTERSGITQNQR